MTLAEILTARAQLAVLRAMQGCWRYCPRCGRNRLRGHRHETPPLGVVLELHRGVGRRGGDVA
jgi:hypothetical protein